MAKRFKKNLLNHIAMALSGASFIIAIINLIFFQNEFLRNTVWVLILLVFVLDFLSLLKINDKELKENLLMNYEILILKESYIKMGEYIERQNIPELNDIGFRIENELRDIEIKKEWYAENLGIKKETNNDKN